MHNVAHVGIHPETHNFRPDLRVFYWPTLLHRYAKLLTSKVEHQVLGTISSQSASGHKSGSSYPNTATTRPTRGKAADSGPGGTLTSGAFLEHTVSGHVPSQLLDTTPPQGRHDPAGIQTCYSSVRFLKVEMWK